MKLSVKIVLGLIVALAMMLGAVARYRWLDTGDERQGDRESQQSIEHYGLPR